MDKIKKVSFIFRILFQSLFICLPIIVGMLWFFAPAVIGSKTGIILSAIPQSLEIAEPLSASTKFLGFLIDLIPLAIIEFILYCLIKLFSLYEKAEIFTLKNVRYIKNVGYALLIGQLLNPLYQALLTMVLTWHNPPGHKVITISISGIDISLIFTGVLTILISWVMAEACKLQEDQKYTI